MKNHVALALVSILFIANVALAGGYITPNTSTAGDTTNTSDGETRNAAIENGNSYCCEFYAVDDGALISEVSTTVDASPDFTAVERTITTPLMAQGKRLCFISTQTASAGFTVVDVAPSTTPVQVQCNETTLFGGYNTNANPFNFLEISNLTNQTINGKIFATNFNGVVVINGANFSVLAGRRTDISLHDAAGPNVFGLLKIVHDGPLGALQANTSFYSGPVSSLELKGTVPAKIRDRR